MALESLAEPNEGETSEGALAISLTDIEQHMVYEIVMIVPNLILIFEHSADAKGLQQPRDEPMTPE
jgi:hypothetical protein